MCAARWTFRPASGGESFDVELEQTFQSLKGIAAHGAAVTGKLGGDEIDFVFGQGAAAHARHGHRQRRAHQRHGRSRRHDGGVRRNAHS